MQVEEIMDKKYKKVKNTTPLLKSWEQKHGALSKSRVLLMPSAHNITSHPFGLDTSLPSPRMWNQLTPAWECKGTCDLFSLSPAAGVPVKPCLKKKKISCVSMHFVPKDIHCVLGNHLNI